MFLPGKGVCSIELSLMCIASSVIKLHLTAEGLLHTVSIIRTPSASLINKNNHSPINLKAASYFSSIHVARTWNIGHP
jgi:hypothetical protein